MSIKTHISLAELEKRQEKIRSLMKEKGLDAVCILGGMRIFYLGGFHHLPTERPVALLIPARERPCFDGPKSRRGKYS